VKVRSRQAHQADHLRPPVANALQQRDRARVAAAGLGQTPNGVEVGRQVDLVMGFPAQVI
jgi:hypothetical protein